MKEINKLNEDINKAIKNKDFEKVKALQKMRVEIKNALIQKFERDILDRCIKKEDLEDGVWYECDDEGLRVARRVGKARWNEEKGKFLYERDKFGHKFEDTMDYFGDVINAGYAGFPPMWKAK